MNIEILKIGIGVTLVIGVTLFNIIRSRKMTVSIAILIQLTTLSTILLNKWLGVGVIIGLSAVLYVRFKRRFSENEEKSFLDYSDSITSVTGIVNTLQGRKENEVVIGEILPTNYKELYLNHKKLSLDNIILSGHTLVTGASGSGKTSLMKAIMNQKLRDGYSIGHFDYKGEKDIVDELRASAEELNVPFYEFSIDTCDFCYDPLINLNETGKVEALMNTRRWDVGGADEHYRTSTQLAIQNAIRKYDKWRKQTGDPRNYIAGLSDFLTNYKAEPNERDGLYTLQKQLEILMTSRAKQLFAQDKRQFSFNTTEQFVVCFSFVSANKQLATSLSSMIFQDLMDRGTRHRYSPNLLLSVDEFGTIENSSIIKDLLEKGRSGGIQIVFSLLDINQIAMSSGEYFVQSILGTINNFVIFAGATQKTAEMLAGVQKFDKSFDIMSLKKPQNGKPPTALFISKYQILSKNRNQEVFRIIPYTYTIQRDDRQPQQQEEKSNVVDLTEVSKPIPIETNKITDKVFTTEEEKVDKLNVHNIDQFL